MAGNKFEVFFSLYILLLDVVKSQITHNGYGLGLTTVPGNIAADTQTLNLAVNQLTTIPAGSLSHLTQLTHLRLNNNKFATFPDIRSVGSTLEKLHLHFNQITYIDPLFVNALVKIVTIYLLGNTGLGIYPDVAGPGNSLSVLFLDNCGIDNFPVMKSMRSLTRLQLTGNTIAEIKANSLIGLDSMQILELNRLLVTEVPDLREVADTLVELHLDGIVSIQEVEQSRFAQLRNLQQLKVPNTMITKIPTLCPKVLSTLVITATGSPLHLCSCENVWLKQASEEGGATINVNDVTCGATMWSAMTTAQLLAVCQPLNVPALKSYKAYMKLSDNFCWFPLHSVVYDATSVHCLRNCLHTPGCVSFNFRISPPDRSSSQRSVGTCVIIAPTVGQVPQVPNSGDPGWQFFSVQTQT